jgi:hypothetical protein
MPVCATNERAFGDVDYLVRYDLGEVWKYIVVSSIRTPARTRPLPNLTARIRRVHMRCRYTTTFSTRHPLFLPEL